MPTIYEAPRLSPNATVTQSQVTGLTSALAGKAALTGGNALSGTQTLTGSIDMYTGTVTLRDSGDTASIVLTGSTGIGVFNGGLGATPLNGSNISGGIVPVARLGSGTPASTTLLNGAGAWTNSPSITALTTSGNVTCNGTLTGASITTSSFVTAPNVWSTVNDQTLILQGRAFANTTNPGVTACNGAFSASSVVNVAFNLNPTDSTTGTGGITALRVNLAGSGSGSGNKRLAELQTAGTTHFFVSSLGNVVCGSAALSTSATNGFFYIDTCNGTPSGVPTTNTGTCACVYDTSANKLWIYNGAWRSVTLA